MAEFYFDEAHTQAEIERVKARNLTLDRLFVLLLGPSATGKSTLIQAMNEVGGMNRFVYVSPIITRPNRPGETDKISVSDETFDDIAVKGGFVVVNELYGVRYGTPLSGILEPLSCGKNPILDYPLHNVEALERAEYDLLRLYVYPQSIGQWQSQMHATGRNVNGRMAAGTAELSQLAEYNFLHPLIDLSVVNVYGAQYQTARRIVDTIATLVE